MRKKERKNKMLVLFMLIIFVLSTVGSVVIYYSNGEETLTRTYGENKYKFVSKSDELGNMFYEVSYKDEKFTTFFLPENLALNLDENTKNIIKNANYFYFAFDPNDESVQLMDYLRFDLRNNLPTGKFFFDSLVDNSTLYNLPKVTCQNSTVIAPVIIVKSSNVTKVENLNSCINIELNSQSVLQVRDSLVYVLNGVEI